MTREEFQTERTRIISEMLDNPDEYGIYPTTKCFEQLDALFDSLSLPPAEGAEAIVKKYEDEYDFKFHWVQRDRVIRMMREFAAQPQPTAEGAKEILEKHLNLQFKDTPEDWTVALIQFNQEKFIAAMQEFATLHAQRIADKMVSERLKEELIRYIKWYGGFNYENMTDEMLVNEYLKTREK